MIGSHGDARWPHGKGAGGRSTWLHSPSSSRSPARTPRWPNPTRKQRAMEPDADHISQLFGAGARWGRGCRAGRKGQMKAVWSIPLIVLSSSVKSVFVEWMSILTLIFFSFTYTLAVEAGLEDFVFLLPSLWSGKCRSDSHISGLATICPLTINTILVKSHKTCHLLQSHLVSVTDLEKTRNLVLGTCLWIRYSICLLHMNIF